MAHGTKITRHQRLRRSLRSPLRHGKLWDNRAGRQYKQAAEFLDFLSRPPLLPWPVRHPAEQETLGIMLDHEKHSLARRGMLDG